MPIGSALYGTLLMFGNPEPRMCLGKMHGFAPAVEKYVTKNDE